MKTLIDTDAIRTAVDFGALLANDLGTPGPGGMFCCPFHPDHSPSFGLLKGNKALAHCFGCGWSGDAIKYTRDRHGLGFREAVEALAPGGAPNRPLARRRPATPRQAIAPGQEWSATARTVCEEAAAILAGPNGRPGRDYLSGRSLDRATWEHFRLGYLPEARDWPPEAWGLPAGGKRIYLPPGILIPWQAEGEVCRIKLRRIDNGEPRFSQARRPEGATDLLFNGDALAGRCPACLVEGEFDALAVHRWAGDLVTPVATGSATACRLDRWQYRLAAAPLVLLAFDSDEAGEDASAWWQARLPSARRLRPESKDPAAMGSHTRGWIRGALEDWTADDRYLFEERVAIAHIDGGADLPAALTIADRQHQRGEGPQ